MFRSLNDKQIQPQLVNLTINGKLCKAPQGQTVWAAMALAGNVSTRISPVTQKPRSAYCAMGVCYECMIEINGMPNQQACLTQVEEGMEVRFQEISEQTSLLYDADEANQLAVNVGVTHDE